MSAVSVKEPSLTPLTTSRWNRAGRPPLRWQSFPNPNDEPARAKELTKQHTETEKSKEVNRLAVSRSKSERAGSSTIETGGVVDSAGCSTIESEGRLYEKDDGGADSRDGHDLGSNKQMAGKYWRIVIGGASDDGRQGVSKPRSGIAE